MVHFFSKLDFCFDFKGSIFLKKFRGCLQGEKGTRLAKFGGSSTTI